MKRFDIFLTLAALLATVPSGASEAKELKLDNGIRMSVEACSDGIFHIRYSPDKTFGESLLERYGIINTALEPSEKPVVKSSGRTMSLSLGNVTLGIDRKTGDICVKKDGTTLVERIGFVPASSPEVEKLAGVINERFSGMNVASNGGIIGDDDGTVSEKDKAESGDPAKSCIISFSLAKGERFYGGGSTSREHIQHRGEILRMHTTYQHTEIPMPYMMSSRGWGVFDNTTRKTYFDVGATIPERMNIYNTFNQADFYIFVRDDMPGVLDAYTLLTGRPYLLPKWAYGLCFGPNMREDQWDILNDAAHFRLSDVPCDVFWLEPQWMEKRYDFSTEKKFNYDKFSPEPYWVQDKYPKKLHNRLFIGKLRNMGFHLGLWLCEEYDLSVQEEDIIAEREGRPQSGQEHWMDHLKTFIDLGVEGFKLDPARTIDEHTYRKYYNGRTDKEMHNLGQVLLPKQMRTLTQTYTGKRSWHHYCAGWTGTQHWSASTSGDNGGGKTALYDQLNLGMSGFMNTSCDVMSVPAELEMQSLHFGMFLPWVQINSWFSMMHPFYYNDFQQTLYRNCVKLRYELMPYIYSMALEGTLTGMPMVRSMPLSFPGDRNCDDMCYQYMFGPSLCVGIFTNDIYLPEGDWYDAWTNEKVTSTGGTFTRSYPSDRAGLLFIRGGSIIPCQHDVKFIGTEPLENLIVKVWPSDSETSYTMYDSDAESYGYENGLVASTCFHCGRDGAAVRFTVDPVRGGFENMPAKRGYEFQFTLDARPSSVSVNGAPAEWTWDEGKVLVAVPDADVTEKYEIIIL